MLRGRWIKVLVFVLCLAPLGYLGWRGYHEDLSANPIEFITRFTGDWTLRFLVITLAITPLRRVLGQADLIRFRRMLGLFAFFYGTLHFTTYIWLDKFFDVREMLHDVYKRPFITAGFTAFVLMIPLAITSTRGWIRRMGKRWVTLHRLIYVSAVVGGIHYLWLVKSAITRPVTYLAIIGLLLAIRVAHWAAGRKRSVRAGQPVQAVR